MSTRKLPALSTVLYVLAGLLVLYTIWAAIHSFGYISRMVAQNQLVIRGNEFEITNFYMSNFAQYALFAVILFALGWILQSNSSAPLDTVNPASSSGAIPDDNTGDDNFEDWFQNNDK